MSEENMSDDGTWSTSEMLTAMEQAHKIGISITCSQDRHGSCFGCRCDCHRGGQRHD